MPGTNELDRQGGKIARRDALYNRAAAPTFFGGWFEYFSTKTKELALAATSHLSLYGVSKFAVSLFTPTYVSELVKGISETPGFKAAVLDYGASVVDDWVKYGAEQIGVQGVSFVSTPSETEKQRGGVDKKGKELCESVGQLAALMAISKKLAGQTQYYCDDAYAQARIIVRAKSELTQAKTQVTELRNILTTLETHLTTVIQGELNTAESDAKTKALETVKKGTTVPHFENDWGTYFSVKGLDPTYRLKHCSKALCFGPGPQSAD